MALEEPRTFNTLAEYKAAYNADGHRTGAQPGLTEAEIGALIARGSLDIMKRVVVEDEVGPLPAPMTEALISPGLNARRTLSRMR